MMTIEEACEIMHDAYEIAAVGAGWETQEASRKPWADVPEANKATMRAAVGALLKAIGPRFKIDWTMPYDQIGSVEDPIWPNNGSLPNVGDLVLCHTPSRQVFLKVTKRSWYPGGEHGSGPFIDVILRVP